MSEPLTAERFDLIRQLFAESTSLIEDAHKASVNGQSPSQNKADVRAHSARIERVCGDVAALVGVIRILVETDNDARDQSSHSEDTG